MLQYSVMLAVAVAVVLGGCAGRLNGGIPLPAPATDQLDSQAALHSPIQHVVIIFQENRSTDNLFQGLPGADIAKWGYNTKHQKVTLHEVPLTTKYDLSHFHSGFVTEYDGGKMDGWSSEGSSHGCHRAYKSICAYGYVPSSENQPYMTMAEQYVFGDRMFQTNQGPSYPAHQYIISGDASALPKSPLNVSSNPLIHGKGSYGAEGFHGAGGFHGNGGGCDAPPGERVDVINAKGIEGDPVYPCFERPALSDLVDAKALSWRYYQYNLGEGLWKGFDSIRHVRYGPDYSYVITPPQTIFVDIKAGNLANVVWVTPDGAHSDHAGSGLGDGPSWVAAVVNAIGKSRYWDSTAIFITWDDWGGWFDHVKPPMYNSYELGFRVPLIVVSPYAKKGYVSHVQHEFGSILKFTEETFGLGSLGTTDVRSDNLLDCFDFKRKPRTFHRIPAPPFVPGAKSQPNPDDDF